MRSSHLYNHNHYHQHPHYHHQNHNHGGYSHNHGHGQVQQMMTFSEFVRGLEPNVDEVSACKQFRNLKTSLTQSKVDKFFDEHKHREWFKLKYHPLDCQTLTQKHNLSFIKRLKIFNDLQDKKYFDNIRYNEDNSQAILNLMNGIIVLLEDGPEELVNTLLSSGNTVLDPSLTQEYIPTKPNSVVIDNLNIDTNLSDIEKVCKDVNLDLLRLCPIDPHYIPGGQLRRKIFAVYKTNVDISDVGWKLSRSKLNNHPLNVYINKNLTDRVRSIDAKSNHNFSVVKDIRNAIIIILNLDELRGFSGRRKAILENVKAIKEEQVIKKENSDPADTANTNGEDNIPAGAPLSPPGSEKSNDSFDLSSLDEDREKEKKKCFDVKFNFDLTGHKLGEKLGKNNNSLLENALPYLTDYCYNSCTNYLLAQVPADLKSKDDEPSNISDFDDNYKVIENTIENLPFSSEQNIVYLDKMLYYLRIVHSFDYYNKTLYRYEDDSSLKLGFVHLRESPSKLDASLDMDSIKEFNTQFDKELKASIKKQSLTYLTKDEERYAYRSYKKNIQNELESFAERIAHPTNVKETVDAYKCKYCTKLFQKLNDVGRHFVGKHRWAVDEIEMETDFFNSYLFDCTKVDPVPPKHLLELPPNRFINQLNPVTAENENENLIQEAIKEIKKLDSIVLQEAPRKQEEADPRNEMVVDYGDVSFDDAF